MHYTSIGNSCYSLHYISSSPNLPLPPPPPSPSTLPNSPTTHYHLPLLLTSMYSSNFIHRSPSHPHPQPINTILPYSSSRRPVFSSLSFLVLLTPPSHYPLDPLLFLLSLSSHYLSSTTNTVSPSSPFSIPYPLVLLSPTHPSPSNHRLPPSPPTQIIIALKTARVMCRVMDVTCEEERCPG